MMENKTEYKSPKYKLLHFFEDSRDKWKDKVKEARKVIHLLKKRVTFLENSREYWRKREKDLKEELNNIKSERDSLIKEIEELKKNQ